MSNNGKARYIPQIKIDAYTSGMDITKESRQQFWQDLENAEPQQSTAAAKKELLKHAPDGKFEYRIVRICDAGKAELETTTRLVTS